MPEWRERAQAVKNYLLSQHNDKESVEFLTSEVERLQRHVEAAQKLAEIYFDIAAAAIGEDAVRAKVAEHVEASRRNG